MGGGADGGDTAPQVCQPKTKVTFKLAGPSQDIRCTTDGTGARQLGLCQRPLLPAHSSFNRRQGRPPPCWQAAAVLRVPLVCAGGAPSGRDGCGDMQPVRSAEPTRQSPDCTKGIEVLESGTVVKAMALGAPGTSPSAVVSSPAVPVQCYQPRIKLVSADAPVQVVLPRSGGRGGRSRGQDTQGCLASLAFLRFMRVRTLEWWLVVLTRRHDVPDVDRALAVGLDR